jgi:hypothetical protein
MERNSIAMMVGGIVLTAGGVFTLGMGALVYAGAKSIQCDCIGPCDCRDEKGEIGGIVLMAGGVAGLAVGIPLIVLGARKVPVEPGPEAAVLIGPGSAGLRCRF